MLRTSSSISSTTTLLFAAVLLLHLLQQTVQVNAQKQLTFDLTSPPPYAKYFDRYTAYYVELEIGTPPQWYKLQLDTGSADLIVWNGGISKNVNWRNSLSMEDTGLNFVQTYGTGSCTAHVFKDTVQAPGFKLTNYTLLGCDHPAGKGNRDLDGILGLGSKLVMGLYEHFPEMPVKPVMSALYETGQIPNLEYTLILNRDNAPGQIIIGGHKTNHCNMNDFEELPIVPKSENRLQEVMVHLADMSANWEGKNDTKLFMNYHVILDSGSTTSSIRGWNKLAEHFGLDWDDEKQFYVAECDLLPTLTFTFQKKTFNLEPETYANFYGRNDAGKKVCQITEFSEPESPYAPDFLLGDNFLRTVCFGVDLSKDVVYLAPRIDYTPLAFLKKASKTTTEQDVLMRSLKRKITSSLRD